MSTAAPSQTRPTEGVDLGDEHAAFLSGPPRSGELSPFAQKFAAQCFIWLASVVVFGSLLDFSSNASGPEQGKCNILCTLSIVVSVISVVFCSIILVGHYLVWSGRIDRGSWFSAAAEKRYMSTLTFWWVLGVAFLSAYKDAIPHTTGLAIIFGWLAFFAAIFGTYKAYHAQKEEVKSLRYAQVISMQATEEEEYANFS